MDQPANPLEEAVERALEAFVYAPIGLLFEGPDPFPALVQKGRMQVTQAKLIGEFAVNREQRRACQRLDARREQLRETLGNLGVPGLAGPGDEAHETEARVEPEPASPVRARTASAARTQRPVPKADLAIPDYDGLSASQVVSRLAGLAPDELEAVRVHESTNRARKTILNKVAQLQA